MTSPCAWPEGAAALARRAARCLRVRQSKVPCDGCSLACTRGSLRLAPGPHVDPDCDGCGLCAQACPTGALATSGEAVSAVRAAARRAGSSKSRRLTVTCQRSWWPGGLRLPCLGTLDLRLLLVIAGQGVKAIVLRPGRCGRCADAARLLNLGAKLAALGRAGGEAGAPPRVEVPAEAMAAWLVLEARGRAADPREGNGGGRSGRSDRRPPGAAGEVDRAARDLLGLRARLAGSPDRLPDADGDPPGRVWLAARLGAAARGEAAPGQGTVAGPSSADAGLPQWFRAGRVEVDGACTGCPVCSRLCPTGALSLDVAPDTVRLTHSAARCVACGVCAATCPAGAARVHLAPVSVALASPPVAVARVAVRRCRHCGAPYRALDPGVEGCPPCQRRYGALHIASA